MVAEDGLGTAPFVLYVKLCSVVVKLTVRESTPARDLEAV